MARKLRVEYPGAIYHVMNRGDRREPIFRDDQDRQRFIATLGEACGKTGWQVHAAQSPIISITFRFLMNDWMPRDVRADPAFGRPDQLKFLNLGLVASNLS